jgi:hypothetical protein
MTDTRNWFKSSWSKELQDCAEVALDGEVGVRDTKDRDGGQLAISASGWTSFIDAVKADH